MSTTLYRCFDCDKSSAALVHFFSIFHRTKITGGDDGEEKSRQAKRGGRFPRKRTARPPFVSADTCL